MGEVRCKTCDIGGLVLVRKYRMSTAGVAIGYVLLIPSVLGMLIAMSTTPQGPGSDLAGGMLVLMGLFWFVGGLLAWLLVMKKSVVQCDNCTATVAASYRFRAEGRISAKIDLEAAT
jgi:hypothetical protein